MGLWKRSYFASVIIFYIFCYVNVKNHVTTLNYVGQHFLIQKITIQLEQIIHYF